MFGVTHHPDNHGVSFRAPRADHMVAQGTLRIAEVVPGKGFVDDRDFGCGGAVGRGEIASGDEGNTKRLQVVIAHPGKLDVVIFIRGRLRSRHRDITVDVVAGEIGIVGGSHTAHSRQCGKRFDDRCSTGAIWLAG